MLLLFSWTQRWFGCVLSHGTAVTYPYWHITKLRIFFLLTHRTNAFLLNKTNRRIEFQFYYWYNNCTFFGQSFCPSSGASQPCNGIGTIYAARSPSCINCTNAVVRLKISWWWAERLPETYTVIITDNKIGNQCFCWFCSQGDARS
jgi:hypothetical protein